MTDQAVRPVRHAIQGKRRGWWPTDRYRQEIDCGDLLMFTDYRGYPKPAFGKVIRIGKTGKVHVEVVKLRTQDTSDQIEIKECQYTMKLSEILVQALLMEKMANCE